MGRRDVALARPCAAVTQRRELWPHALQLSARSRWVPSTCSPHRPRSWHPQAAEMLLGAPPRATSHCCRVQRCCQHGHSPPPRMLHQHPRVSRMAGPQGPGAGDPRDTAPRIPVPSPAAAVGHSLSGWTSTPVPPKKQTVRVSRGQRLQRCTHLTLRAPLALQHSGLLPHSFAVGVQGTPGTGEAVGAQWELKAGGCAHPEPPEPGHRVGALVPQPSSAPAASADLGQPPRTAVLGVAQPGGGGGPTQPHPTARSPQPWAGLSQ